LSSVTGLKTPPARLIIVYLTTLINITLATLVIITVIHSKSGSLHAQDDLSVFMLVMGGGAATALVCLITILIEILSKISAPSLTKEILRNQIIVLGVINLLIPLLWLFGLLWLIRS
jgi:hypothetical protein